MEHLLVEYSLLVSTSCWWSISCWEHPLLVDTSCLSWWSISVGGAAPAGRAIVRSLSQRLRQGAMSKHVLRGCGA